MPYRLDESTGLIDYDELEKFAVRFRPKILIAGFSAYSRHYDYPRMRQVTIHTCSQMGGGFSSLQPKNVDVSTVAAIAVSEKQLLPNKLIC